jgi:hypothetical protein
MRQLLGVHPDDTLPNETSLWIVYPNADGASRQSRQPRNVGRAQQTIGPERSKRGRNRR